VSGFYRFGRLGEPGIKFCILGITAEGGEVGRLFDLKTERAGRDEAEGCEASRELVLLPLEAS